MQWSKLSSYPSRRLTSKDRIASANDGAGSSSSHDPDIRLHDTVSIK